MTESRASVWVLAAVTLGLGAAAAPSLLTMQDQDVSLVGYQLATTSDNVAALNAKLGEEGLDALRTSLWWDYPFLLCLGVLLAVLCIRTGRRMAARGRTRLAAASRVFTAAAVVYAVCDGTENALLFQLADGETAQPWPGITFVVAAVKWTAFFATLGYLLTALALGRVRSEDRVATSAT